jgi:ketosteroid isomerase-like protein
MSMVRGATPFDATSEQAAIEKVIRASIEWAIDKDKDLLFDSVAQDAGFFIFHPDSASTIAGFDAFKNMVEGFFMNDGFKATGSEIKDLQIHLARSGEVAWYSAYLDDFGEWQGKPTRWVNTRWTGVLEKREGKWVIAQMHFSFAS